MVIRVMVESHSFPTRSPSERPGGLTPCDGPWARAPADISG